MSEITVTWKKTNKNLEIRECIREYFEGNHLNCEVTSYGLYITCDNEKKAYSYMWRAMYDLVKKEWFRNEVESCVWKDGSEIEDVIKSSAPLIVNGEIKLPDFNAMPKEEPIDEVILTWENCYDDLEVHQRVKKYFEKNHLECEETLNGLHITCNDKKKGYSYMWISMMDLAECVWFRNAVRSCVWKCGSEWEDVISSTDELIKEGEMSVHD